MIESPAGENQTQAFLKVRYQCNNGLVEYRILLSKKQGFHTDDN
jgi:hypothetical protein